MPAATPSRQILFILSRVGGGGPITKFLGLPWSSMDPATFDGPLVFELPSISQSRCFFRVSPLFFGVPPTFGVSGLPPRFLGFCPLLGSRRIFEVWLSPKVWQSPEVRLSPKVRPSPKVFPSPDSRSVCHPTPGLSVTWLWSVRHLTLVCPSPGFGLFVTRFQSVRHLALVCPSPGLGLSATRPWSVRHPTSVCPSPDIGLSVTRPCD